MRELMEMLLDIFYDIDNIDTRGEPKKKKNHLLGEQKKKNHSQETKP